MAKADIGNVNMKKEIANVDKARLIEILTEELPALRAKIGYTQDDLCDAVGISRQTYSSIETKKKKKTMSWNIFLSLIMFYSTNKKTSPILESIGAFPKAIRESFNISKR